MLAELTQLKKLRMEMEPRISQEDIARFAHITLVTYRKVEHGGNTTYSTAKAILKALNSFRAMSRPRLEEIPETEIPKLFNLM